MLYECRGIVLDLARIVTVGPLSDRNRMAYEGRCFEVCMTGIKMHVLFKAPDK